MRWMVPFLLAIAPATALHAASSDQLSYVLFTGKNQTTMISGSSEDYRWAHSLRTGDSGLLFARQGDAAYVIRDPTTLRRAEAIMKPQQELGARQGELGRQQGELGRRQGALGAEQGRLGALMADTSARRMGELGKQQAALGRRQAELGKEQAALGSRQAELGREQARLAKLAEPQLRALVAEAIRSGVAQRVR